MRRRVGERSAEAGDTLVEVLLAIAIVGITVVALVGTVLTSITGSGEHRSLAVDDTVLKAYASAVVQQVERQASPQFVACATPSSYSITPPGGIPSGYTASITSIQYWTGSGWSTTCPAGNALQLVTISASSPTQVLSSLAVVVRNPS